MLWERGPAIMKYDTRARITYAFLAAIMIVAGLATRILKKKFPMLGDAAGDACWATMAFMIISFVFPTVPLIKRAIAAVAVAWGVEFSQLYHAPWIDRIRAKFLGAMILGSSFDVLDLLWYVCGVAVGVAMERLVLWRRKIHLQR